VKELSGQMFWEGTLLDARLEALGLRRERRVRNITFSDCHLGARNFEQGSTHNKTPEQLGLIESNKLSCVSSGCHEFVHDIASLKDATFWKEKP